MIQHFSADGRSVFGVREGRRGQPCPGERRLFRWDDGAVWRCGAKQLLAWHAETIEVPVSFDEPVPRFARQ